ncbi:MAG: DNA repair protein RecN, partial [Solirubrobacterales bacterium]
ERAELRFGPGLNVITGETGAGKTVLAHSLDLLLGGRPRSAVVRPGCDEAWVEGTFALPEGLRDDPELEDVLQRVPPGDEVTLARRVSSSSGRSAAFVAGRSATAPELRLLGSRLLAFYGQHEHRKLTLSAAQAEVLDGFAGPDHLELRSAYRESHANVTALVREGEELAAREGAREREIDLLRFELGEIDEAGVEPGEFEALESERGRLRHAEALRESAATALLALSGNEQDGGASASLAAAEGALARSSGVDPQLDGLAGRAIALGVEVSDLAGELRTYVDGIEGNPETLEGVEQRMQTIERLLRKHGGTTEAVFSHGEHCRAQLDALSKASDRLTGLEIELGEAREVRAALAARLSTGRAGAARDLETAVAAALAELAMEGARLEVALQVHPEEFGPAGAETIELRVATNRGMPMAPLRDAASGGELSRVMLALAALGPGGQAPTLVFDEIDAGVGGVVARRVGERLQRLGEDRQVVCITHLAQVASLASTHFRVEKAAGGAATVATVDAVSGADQLAEIVRMLGADSGDEAASRHARELLAA